MAAQSATRRMSFATPLKRQFGINENLAREILELHTLGVNGGYTQRDVTSFAQIITGWSIGGGKGRLAGGETGRFFDEQSPESLLTALHRFEAEDRVWAEPCRRQAERFSPAIFQRELSRLLIAWVPEVFNWM